MDRQRFSFHSFALCSVSSQTGLPVFDKAPPTPKKVQSIKPLLVATTPRWPAANHDGGRPKKPQRRVGSGSVVGWSMQRLFHAPRQPELQFR